MLVEHILLLALSSVGVLHGLSLGMYLLISRELKSLPNQLLGILLVLFGLRISKSIFLYFTPDLDLLFIKLGLTLILSFGPLFYFYTRSYLDENFEFGKHHLGHAVPFVLFFALNSFGLPNKAFYIAFGIYFIYLHALAYIVVSFLWQRKFRKTITGVTTTKRKWMNLIHLGIVFVWISYFMFLLNEAIIPYIAGPITYSLVIYPLSFWAIAHKVVSPDKKKYQNSRLGGSESQKLLESLEVYMQDAKPFLNADLKLAGLAGHLKVSPHELSQAVNENRQQNFQQYLNAYRVKSAQEMLDSAAYDHLTISAIAYESGFNSLSAFNTAFKKVLRTTPSRYRKERGS